MSRLIVVALAVLMLTACGGDKRTALEREVAEKKACEDLGGQWVTQTSGLFRGTRWCRRSSS